MPALTLDGDGIRDDIQRYIAFTYPGDENADAGSEFQAQILNMEIRSRAWIAFNWHIDGQLGICSACYSVEKTDIVNNEKLLVELRDVPEEQRGRYYVCAVSFYDPKMSFLETISGEWQGRVVLVSRDVNGFG